MSVTVKGISVAPPEAALKIAFTVVLEFSVNAQEPVPEHVPPDQPAKLLPAAAVALRVTVAPCGSDSEHIEPQFRLPPVRITVPPPVPIFPMEMILEVSTAKFAVIDLLLSIVTEHAPLPEQFPDQPLKIYPDAGVASRFTCVPLV